ncbi:hypothetical protein D3C73_1225390 [compost metagenome]
MGADHRLGGAQDAERRSHVAVNDRVPLLVAHLLDHVVPGETGVVDDDVDRAVGLDGGLHETVSEVRRRDAAHARHSFSASGTDLGDHFLSRFSIQVVNHDFRAVGGQLQSDFTTNATAGTGDQSDFAFKLFHFLLFL